MAAKEKTSTPVKGVPFKDLGIGAALEADRIELSERGAFQIVKFYVDTRSQYYNKTTGEGGILKFNGVDISTGQMMKYRTTSKVMIENFKEMSKVVGYKEEKDEDGNVWNVFKSPVDIDGIEMVSSKTPGHKAYPKIIISS